MLMLERTVRHCYSDMLGPEVKMPRKGHTLYLSSPYHPCGIGVWWTDKKSPEGKRLFNVGPVSVNGKEPEFFR